MRRCRSSCSGHWAAWRPAESWACSWAPRFWRSAIRSSWDGSLRIQMRAHRVHGVRRRQRRETMTSSIGSQQVSRRIGRRAFVAAIAGSLFTPLVSDAQKAPKVARVGILNIGPPPGPQELAKSVSTNRFWLSMKQLGWVEGQNMAVERRFGESTDQLRKGAADLVRLKVDVLFVASAGRAKLLQLETQSIRIVLGRAEGDRVAAGHAASLAKPGGNITGSQVLHDDIVPKRLEILKTLVPNLSKVALLREDVSISALPELLARYDEKLAAAARSLGIGVRTFIVHGEKDLAVAFAAMVKDREQGLLVTSSAFMFVHRQAIVDLAATQRVPAVYEVQVFVEVGGLLSYGVDFSEMQLRAATYVDKILRGARPADLPIEQPTKFDLVINMRSARALGLTIPPSLLARADQVIQ